MARLLNTSTALILAALSGSASAQDSLAPHVHGAAELQVVLDGQLLSFSLQSPAYNLVGFEHAPKTEEEKALLAELDTTMRSPSNWIKLPDAAGCALDHAEVGQHEEMTLNDHDDDHSHDHEHEHEHEHENGGNAQHMDEHMDLSFDYRFTCRSPQAIKSATVTLFERYPALESIEAQIINETQSIQTLSADNPQIRFK
ncbi:putative zinc-binding protein [Marinobacterium lacunae]|uniref:Putative zinc-binding protein n=1 Tax=Marinobacterium lacunae TaxID=1232683 RepID=A0A081FXX7_9GAMM|nr:DUF2796 domain-containing protein [Marinobacterium lacunae]KEA63382.1 putative zinc-binding protein [Marinobacterium lacunae]